MDSITQIALGAAIGEAGFRKRLGGKAPIVGGICGLLPDLDFAMSMGDRWASMLYHRGASHSLVVLPVVAFAVGWVAWRWAKREGQYLDWVHLSFWALVTHPLLDVCTSYGTQLFAPFSRARYAIDAAAIVDPLYSLPLAVACVFAWRGRDRDRAQKVAIAALVISTLYLGYGYYESQSALSRGRAALAAEGFEPVRVRALPTLLQNQLFRIVARDAEGNQRVGFHSNLAPGPIEFHAIEVDDDPRVRRVLETWKGRRLTWFTDEFLIARMEEGGESVRAADLRIALYRDPEVSVFSARARLDDAGAVSSFEMLGRDELGIEMRAELATLWGLLIQGR